MKLLVLPREANNPYQSLLYGALRQHNVRVAYLGELTRSRTLNQLLLPVELVARRIGGSRVVHLHWAYAFTPVGVQRFPVLRWLAQTWFALWLHTLRLLGMHLVWTAHNVLPMERIFVDDLQARRRLVAASSLVIAHSPSTLNALSALGMAPRRSEVIPHGPYTANPGSRTPRAPGTGPGPRRFLFFGVVKAYKGADTLLAAYAMLPADLDVSLAIVGECSDPALAEELTRLASQSPHPVETRFEWVSEDQVSGVLNEADVIVLPYRETTTSGSAMLMLTHGRPLVVPDLPSLAELPDAAVVRYDGTVHGLSSALAGLAEADADVLAKMSAAGSEYCTSISWDSIAQRTVSAIAGLT